MSVVLTGGIDLDAYPTWYKTRSDSFMATSASITVLLKDRLGNETPVWLPDGNTVMFYIYNRVSNYADIPSNELYHYYSKFHTPARSGKMTKGSSIGQYTATYSQLSGKFTFFAVPTGPDIDGITL